MLLSKALTVLAAMAAAGAGVAQAHSWMTCPTSLNPSPYRGGDTTGPCEPDAGGPVTQVTAGQRLKVAWAPNNHGGGYVRVSLVPDWQRSDAAAYTRNIIKLACYGHPQNGGYDGYGSCTDPCKARPACEWQTNPFDIERYDTSIAIPSNLAEGTYFLQTTMLVGNAISPYYSCGKIYVRGGNPNQACSAVSNPPSLANRPNCLKAAGPVFDAILPSGSRMGPFCYTSAGETNVDWNIAQVAPVNRGCDTMPTGAFRNDCPGNPNPINPNPPVAPTTTAARATTRATTRTTTRATTRTTTRATTRTTTRVTTRTTTRATTRTTATRTTTQAPPAPTSGCPVPDAPCLASQEGLFYCSGKSSFVRCVYGRYVSFQCGAGLKCFTTGPGQTLCNWDDGLPFTC